MKPVKAARRALRKTIDSTHRIALRCLQIILLRLKHSSDAQHLIVHFAPAHRTISGGIMSIVSIHQETEKLSSIHRADCIMCNMPGDFPLVKYTAFRNRTILFNFSDVLRYYRSLQKLTLHLPEIHIQEFLERSSVQDRATLGAVPELIINVMLQNIRFMPKPDLVTQLHEMATKVTCTTAHVRYTTQATAAQMRAPVHLFSTCLSPEQYAFGKYSEKKNLLIVSPDKHPLKSAILAKIERALPSLEIQIISGISHMEYKRRIADAKWALTFGEGLDGYFVETVFCGGIAFAAANEDFFTEGFSELQSVYPTYEILGERIVGDIMRLDHESAYKSCQAEEYALCAGLYSSAQYLENLKQYYLGNYTIDPIPSILETQECGP